MWKFTRQCKIFVSHFSLLFLSKYIMYTHSLARETKISKWVAQLFLWEFSHRQLCNSLKSVNLKDKHVKGYSVHRLQSTNNMSQCYVNMSIINVKIILQVKKKWRTQKFTINSLLNTTQPEINSRLNSWTEAWDPSYKKLQRNPRCNLKSPQI